MALGKPVGPARPPELAEARSYLTNPKPPLCGRKTPASGGMANWPSQVFSMGRVIQQKPTGAPRDWRSTR